MWENLFVIPKNSTTVINETNPLSSEFVRLFITINILVTWQEEGASVGE